MTPGLSGEKTRGRGCDRGTDQIYLSPYANGKPNSQENMFFDIYGEGLLACPALCNLFPKPCMDLAPVARRLQTKRGPLAFQNDMGYSRSLNRDPRCDRPMPCELG